MGLDVRVDRGAQGRGCGCMWKLVTSSKLLIALHIRFVHNLGKVFLNDRSIKRGMRASEGREDGQEGRARRFKWW